MFYTDNNFRGTGGAILNRCDQAIEWLVYAMILFAPWAFGTTQRWSMDVMNAGAFCLGVLHLTKLIARRAGAHMTLPDQSLSARRAITIALAAVSFLFLVYCLIAALNARSIYLQGEWRFEERPHIEWLPSSFDRNASLQAFWDFFALACVFWSVRGWLQDEVGAPASDSAGSRSRVPLRLQRLLWLLALNGALVAFEGILQRTSGTAKLLWFMETRENREAAAQFGPYAYRANAAQFFNLVWPAALGFWWHLQFSLGTRRHMQRRHLLIPCVLLLTSASLISLSRGGVIVTIFLLTAIGGTALVSKRIRWLPKVSALAVFAGIVALAWYVGWEELSKRFRESAANPLSGRAETYQLAQRMAKDYVWFGTGPNTFVSVFQLYRNSPEDYWPAQLHNDWMEFRITLGRAGMGILLVALALIAAAFFTRGRIRVDSGFVACLWIALAGCLLHARFDFPLQIYSIQFVVVLLCAILTACSRARHQRAP